MLDSIALMASEAPVCEHLDMCRTLVSSPLERRSSNHATM